MKKEIVVLLNRYLADLSVEYVKLHNLHWNVIGVNFKAVHEYLEELYNNINKSYDEIAELLKIHNEVPSASIKEYLSLTDIEEIPSLEMKTCEVLKTVLIDFEKLKSICERILLQANEENLYDIVTKMENDLDSFNKSMWFINATIK